MIRTATPKDAAAVCRLINDVIAAPHITFRSTPKTTADVLEMITSDIPVWLWCEREDVLGYATYGTFRSSDGYARSKEHSIALSRDIHGKGVGRKLMQPLEDHAFSCGVHVLVAGISAANPKAIRFHKAIGFTYAGTLPAVGMKAGQWQDLVFMTKQIGRDLFPNSDVANPNPA